MLLCIAWFGVTTEDSSIAVTVPLVDFEFRRSSVSYSAVTRRMDIAVMGYGLSSGLR
jgi:hypothetical protein